MCASAGGQTGLSVPSANAAASSGWQGLTGEQLVSDDASADVDSSQQSMASILAAAVERMQQHGTWKTWQWPATGAIFHSASSFW